MPHNDIENLGRGLIPDYPDSRDFNAAFMMAGATPVNWDVEFRLDEPPNENQGSSDSCVAHSSSYLHWHFARKLFSRRDLFSRIAQTYGAYLRDGVKTICEIGQQTKDECSDPTNQTMTNMRVKSSLPDSAGADDLEQGYYLAGDNIETMAQSVRDLGGSVFGVFGDNAGWQDYTNPSPPNGEPTWAHAIRAFGYHMHNGMKCIIAKSSWCSGTHHEHHIRENYFNAGQVFNNWILIPKENPQMINRYLVDKNGKLGVLVSVDGDGIFTDTVFWAKNELHLAQMKVQYEIPVNAKVITYPI